MVNSESPIKSWNFTWVPQKMTHIMGNRRSVGADMEEMVRFHSEAHQVWRNHQETHPIHPGEVMCFACQSVSRVSLQILPAPHEVMKQNTGEKKSPVKLKISLVRTIFLSLMTSLYNSSISRTSGTHNIWVRTRPQEKNTGPNYQKYRTGKPTSNDLSKHCCHMAVYPTSGFRMAAGNRKQIPSWFVKILDTISKWGPKYICIEHTTIWQSRIIQGASVQGDLCVFSRATNGITNCQVLFSFTWPSWPMDAHGSILSPKGTTIFSLPLSISVSLLPTPSIWFSSLN